MRDYFFSLLILLLVSHLLTSPVIAAPVGSVSEAVLDELPTVVPEEAGMSSPALDKVKPAMQAFVDNKTIAGAIVIVARHGKVVLHESVGWADIESNMPMEKDSILRFYSMTKPITSLAVMMLVEEGKIELDGPVSQYLPELKSLTVSGADGESNNARPITVRELLRHTSGFDYGEMYSVFEDQNSLEDAIGELPKHSLVCQPSTKFEYGISSDVLGAVVERVTGISLSDFFQERIFKPLDMRDTDFYVVAEKSNRFATNYGPTEDGNELKVVDSYSDSRYLSPPKMYLGGEGLVSTARDYIRFCVMMLNQGELNGTRIISTESVQAMTRNQLPEGAYPMEIGGVRPGVGFGLGFDVVVEQTDHTASSPIGEYGWGGAASTHFWISPKDDLAVVVLSQYMPFSTRLEDTVKPLIYDAITE